MRWIAQLRAVIRKEPAPHFCEREIVAARAARDRCNLAQELTSRAQRTTRPRLFPPAGSRSSDVSASTSASEASRGQRHQEAAQEDAQAQEAQALEARPPQAQALAPPARGARAASPFAINQFRLHTRALRCAPLHARTAFRAVLVRVSATSSSIRLFFLALRLDEAEIAVLRFAATVALVPRCAWRKTDEQA